MVVRKVARVLEDFFRFGASGGVLLVLAMVAAMVVENSPWRGYYDLLLGIPAALSIGNFEIAKPLLLWINDGLMAIFFFQIGLEIKREILDGELADPARIVLPIVAAVGGMAVPAAIYSIVNWGDPVAMKGWAIPSATDIAFALGVVALLGSRVPRSLKLFLMTLAIADDLGAIVVIALFYTADVSLKSLLVASVVLFALYTINRRGVVSLVPYLFLSVIMWAAVLKSGVHATLAGVIAAFFIPYRPAEGDQLTRLERLEQELHPVVVFVILPVFAFANTGISFSGVTIDSFLHPVPLGIGLGLFLGNQIGITGFTWVAVRLGLARLPADASWLQVYGIAALCGIGFTMSLFIGSLAFEKGGPELVMDERLGIITGSLLSAITGYLVLRFAAPGKKDAGD